MDLSFLTIPSLLASARSIPAWIAANPGRAMKLLLKVSRPGCWQATTWLYFLPTGGVGGNYALLQTVDFWVGLFYACWPMNALLYVMNDIVDVETDARNPRKGGCFGAKASRADLQKILILSVLANIPFSIYFCYSSGPHFLLLLGAFFAANIGYNWWPKFSDMPPWDLVFPLSYTIVIPFSMYVNGIAWLPVRSWVWALLLVFRVQMLTELIDIVYDMNASRPTSLVLLGPTLGTAATSSAILLELQIVTRFFDNHYWLVAFEIFALAQVLCLSNKVHPVYIHLVTVCAGIAFMGSIIHGWLNGVFVTPETEAMAAHFPVAVPAE